MTKAVQESLSLTYDRINHKVIKMLAKGQDKLKIDLRHGADQQLYNELFTLEHLGLITFSNPDTYPEKVIKLKRTTKPVQESKLTEGVLDDMDDDGFMAKRQLYDLAKYSVELHRIIQDTDNLEPWISAKITKAQDYIETVKHYMEYNNARNAGETADQMGAVDMADIDDVAAQVAGEVEYVTTEQLMADADPTIDDETLDGMDILRMASARGIISQRQFDDPEPVLLDMAQGMADMLSPEDVAGSSDVSILMKEFVATAEAELVLLLGPKVDAYYSMTEAKRIYEKMMRGVKGKK
jgi:hypothetical protein